MTHPADTSASQAAAAVVGRFLPYYQLRGLQTKTVNLNIVVDRALLFMTRTHHSLMSSSSWLAVTVCQ